MAKHRKHFSKDHTGNVLDGLQRWCKDCARERTAISNKEGKSSRKQALKKAKESAERGSTRFSKYREYNRPTEWSV